MKNLIKQYLKHASEMDNAPQNPPSLSLSVSLSLSLTHAQSQSLSLSLSLTLSQSHDLSVSLSQSHSLSISLSVLLSQSHSLSLTLCLTLYQSHSLSVSLSLSLSDVAVVSSYYSYLYNNCLEALGVSLQEEPLHYATQTIHLLSGSGSGSRSGGGMEACPGGRGNYLGLEAGVELGEEGRLVLLSQHSLLHHGALHIVILDHHVLLQDLDGVKLRGGLHLRQHHLGRETDIWNILFCAHWFSLCFLILESHHVGLHASVAYLAEAAFPQHSQEVEVLQLDPVQVAGGHVGRAAVVVWGDHLFLWSQLGLLHQWNTKPTKQTPHSTEVCENYTRYPPVILRHGTNNIHVKSPCYHPVKCQI